MPIIAPNRTTRRIQCRLCDPVVTPSCLRLFTTGAASSINRCHGTMPVSTTATAM